MTALSKRVPCIQAVFFDCGDTIIDEQTEVKLPDSEIVVQADFIPGAQTMLRQIHAAGYRMALVADGPRETFENVLKPAGLWDLFEAHIISCDIGELKPSPKMFAAAFDKLGLDAAEADRVVMIGNNLSRDIRGANEFGLTSVFLSWSMRRSHEPQDAREVPDHVIRTPSDVLPLLTVLEEVLQGEAG